jgi:Protein of unknown function (DUF2637)
VVIDGTIVVALLTVVAAKRTAIRAAYPWALAGLFSLASVAFNIAHAPDRPVAQLVFAMAPVALVLTTHLLMQQVGWRHRHAGPDQTQAPVASAAVDADPLPLPTDAAAGMSANASATAGSGPDRAGPPLDLPLGIAGRWPDTTGPTLNSQTAMSGPELGLQARARQIYQEHCAAGRPVSGAALARQLGTSERHGRRLLAEFRAEDEGSARRNGDGAAQHKQAGPMPG